MISLFRFVFLLWRKPMKWYSLWKRIWEKKDLYFTVLINSNSKLLYLFLVYHHAHNQMFHQDTQICSSKQSVQYLNILIHSTPPSIIILVLINSLIEKLIIFYYILWKKNHKLFSSYNMSKEKECSIIMWYNVEACYIVNCSSLVKYRSYLKWIAVVVSSVFLTNLVKFKFEETSFHHEKAVFHSHG